MLVAVLLFSSVPVAFAAELPANSEQAAAGAEPVTENGLPDPEPPAGEENSYAAENSLLAADSGNITTHLCSSTAAKKQGDSYVELQLSGSNNANLRATYYPKGGSPIVYEKALTFRGEYEQIAASFTLEDESKTAINFRVYYNMQGQYYYFRESSINATALKVLNEIYPPYLCTDNGLKNLSVNIRPETLKIEGYTAEKLNGILDEIRATARQAASGSNSSYQKIKAVSEWMQNNIAMDGTRRRQDFAPHQNLANPYLIWDKYMVPSPDAKRTATGYGYAQLTQLMLEELGITCLTVRGSFGDDTACNLVHLDGKWLMLNTAVLKEGDVFSWMRGFLPDWEMVDNQWHYSYDVRHLPNLTNGGNYKAEQVMNVYGEVQRVNLVTNSGTLKGPNYTYVGVTNDSRTNYYVNLESPQRAGSNFIGWFGNNSMTGQGYDKNSNVKDYIPETLYASWTSGPTNAENIVVRFDSDGADTPASPANVVVEPDDYRLGNNMPTDPVKDHFTFQGWRTQKNGGGDSVSWLTKMSDYVVSTDPNSVTVYAYWQRNSLGVEFTADGLTSPLDKTFQNVVLSKDTTLGQLPTDPVKEGYSFNGWYTQENGQGRKINADTDLTDLSLPIYKKTVDGKEADYLKLYAHFTDIREKYTVSFNVDGSVVSSQTVTHGEYATKPSTDPYKAGYGFTGWYTDSAATNKFNFYTTVTGNLTLYAGWAESSVDKLTVMFDTGGISAAPSNVTVTAPYYRLDASWSGLQLQNTDKYYFNGWLTEKNNPATGITAISNLSDYAVNSVVTLYANYQYKGIVVNFISDGGVLQSGNNSVNMSFDQGNSLGNRMPVYSWSGKTFTGWNTIKDGSGTTVTADTNLIGVGPLTNPTATSNGNLNLYAQFAEVPAAIHTVLLNYNYSSSTNETVKVENGQVLLRPAAPTRAGYGFTGWYTDAAATKAYNFETPVTSDMTLYAGWSENLPNSLTVVFDTDGIASAPASRTISGPSYNLWTDWSSLQLQATHKYYFRGWLTEKGNLNSDTSSMENLLPYAKDGVVNLYAGWELRPITVYFISGQASTPAGETYRQVELKTNKTLQTLPTAPTKINDEFTGWNTKQDGSGTAVTATTDLSQFDADENHGLRLYAQWKFTQAESHRVVFDQNYAGGTQSSQVVADGQKLAKPSDPVRTGYTFLGWYKDAAGNSEFNFNTYISQGITLYAKWISTDEITHTVVFNKNYAGSTEESQKVLNGKTVTKPSDPVRDGYKFEGWYTDNSGTTEYNFNTAVTAELTLYAKWSVETKPSVTYTVKFDADGGSPAPADITVSEQDGFRIGFGKMPISPVKTDYYFQGWFTQAGGKGTEVRMDTDLSAFVSGETVTVYAYFVYKTIGVSFSENGGTLQSGERFVNVRFLESNTLGNRMPVVSRENYNFNGWNTKEDGTGIIVTKDTDIETLKDQVNSEDILRLYAHWTLSSEGSVNVTFNYNYSGSTSDSITVEKNSRVTRPADPARSGYSFDGWYTDAAGTTPFNFNMSVNNSLTIYAKWISNTAVTHNVTFNHNYSGGTSESVRVEEGKTVSRPANPSRSGYSFGGWYTDSSCTAAYDFNAAVTTGLTLYAKWTAEGSYSKYYVVFNADGGSPAPSNTTVSEQFDYKLGFGGLPTNLTKTDYYFQGWFTQPGGKGVKVSIDTDLSAHASGDTVNLYAYFAFKTVGVYFNSTGGDIQSGNTFVQVKFLESNTLGDRIPVVSRQNYSFNGWNSREDGTGTAVTRDTDIETLKNQLDDKDSITLYAQWTSTSAGSHTVSFNLNYSGAANSSKTVENNTAVARPADPTRAGYSFAGWYTDSNGSTAYNFSSPVTGDLTLYAKWTQQGKGESYTVVFNAAGGSPVPTNVTVNESGSYQIGFGNMPTDPAKDKYIFQDWYTQENGQGQRVGWNTNLSSYASGGIINLYAHFIYKSIGVSFNGSGGDLQSGNAFVSVNFGQAKTLGNRIPVFTKTGSVFEGWNTSPDGTGTTVTASTDLEGVGPLTGATENDNGTLTLYAQWKSNTGPADSYDVIFNVENGSAVPSVKAEGPGYQLGNKMPARPSSNKERYVFVGWYSQANGKGTAINETTNLSEFASGGNINLYAYFVYDTVEVFFLGDGVDLPSDKRTVSIDFTQTNKLGDKMPTVSRENNIFEGWNTKADGTGMTVDANTDLETVKPLMGNSYIYLYAQWRSLPAGSYVVRFNSQGGSAVPSQTVKADQTVQRPADPTREGYRFIGWYIDSLTTVFYGFGSPVTGNLELYARWTEDIADTVIVSFNRLQGDTYAVRTMASGSKVSKPDPDPIRTGYKFEGWCTDIEATRPYNFDTAVTSDLTLYARWSISKHIVKFDLGPGFELTSMEVPNSAILGEPKTPTKSGYVFAGWFTDKSYKNAYDFESRVTGDLTLYGKWTSVPSGSFVVKFDSQGGSAVADQVVKSGETAQKPANPTRAGYSFGGWFSDAGTQTPYSFTSPVTASTTLYAKWTTQASFTVNFNSQGGSAVASQTVKADQAAQKPADPTKEGQKFVGWYTDSAATIMYIFGTPVTGNLELYARWLPDTVDTAIVKFHILQGSTYAVRTIEVGGKVTKPEPDPIRTGYKFEGWYTDSAATRAYNFDTAVSADMDLYAKWTASKHTVKFNLGEEFDEVTVEVPHNAIIERPTDPARSTHNFDGWFIDKAFKTAYDFSSLVTGDMTIYGKWTPKELGATYNIVFDSQGGSKVENQIVKGGSKVIRPNNPTRSNGRFVSWCLDAAGTKEFNFDTVINSGFTLYAKWELVAGPGPETEMPYISGYEDGRFRPDNSISRAEAVTILYNLYGEETSISLLNQFNDINANHWSAKAMAWAIDKGIIVGDAGTKRVRPDHTISRGELAIILQRVDQMHRLTENKTANSGSSFNDITGHWARQSIEHLAKYGVINGYEDGSFRPNANVTRAETVKMVSELLGRSTSYNSGKSFSDVRSNHWAYSRIMNAVNGYTAS